MAEGFPPAAEQESAMSDNDRFARELEVVLTGHSLEDFNGEFGLGLEELSQVVIDGDGHQGTVAKMLTDERCPVGKRLKEAFAQGGLEAVENKIEKLHEFDPEFNIVISRSTRTWHAENLKKK